jgi:riboflavin synthase
LFTGIIQQVAEVKSISKVDKTDRAAAIAIGISLQKKKMQNLKTGDSLSINGVCLTALRISKTITFELINETVNRTCLGLLKAGDKVNVERSLRLGDRLEGHYLLGHVEGIGLIKKIIKSSSGTKFWIKLRNRELLSGIVPKGSIAVDGVSLTVIDIDVKSKVFSVGLIPHTLRVTTLGLKSVGERVNIETDIVARYLARCLPRK